ncbi:helix-turn-helix domain-containing protein [Massilia sp. PWRC2]|uniref:helix-turn-helix domain-containing protein n=1 Tax=Massilia sp. PWRC2 TaxID=2804626 RepID=UPI003CE889A2
MSAERADRVEQAAAGASADSNAAPGKILAAQRESMGWTVEQVADQLKLAVRQVVAIEAGDSAALPGPAVVRGFVRAYAKIVRLDPIPLVAKISLDVPGISDSGHSNHAALRHGKPASFSEVRFPSHGKRAAVPIVPIVAVLVLAGAVAAAWHFGLLAKLSNRADTASTGSAVTAPSAPSASASASTVAAPLTTVPVANVLPVQSLQNSTVPLISVPPPSSVTPGSPSAAVAGVGVPAAAASADTAAAAGANALVIAVREDSWIEIRRAKGAPLIARLVKAGNTERFDLTEPVTLVVGKPGAVSATLRGAALDLPVASGGAVARVSLK